MGIANHGAKAGQKLRFIKYDIIIIMRINISIPVYTNMMPINMTTDYIGSHPFVINLIYIYLFTPLARKAHKPQRLYFK